MVQFWSSTNYKVLVSTKTQSYFIEYYYYYSILLGLLDS
jgi:hypothetical protein